MKYDLSQPISQRGYGAYDAENRRIKEISDELQRLCRLHEAQPRTGQEDRGRFEIEQRVAEQYAKSVGMWIPMDDVFERRKLKSLIKNNAEVNATGVVYTPEVCRKGS